MASSSVQSDTRVELTELLKRRNELTVSETHGKLFTTLFWSVHYLECVSRRVCRIWNGRYMRLKGATWRTHWHMGMLSVGGTGTRHRTGKSLFYRVAKYSFPAFKIESGTL